MGSVSCVTKTTRWMFSYVLTHSVPYAHAWTGCSHTASCLLPASSDNTTQRTCMYTHTCTHTCTPDSAQMVHVPLASLWHINLTAFLEGRTVRWRCDGTGAAILRDTHTGMPHCAHMHTEHLRSDVTVLFLEGYPGGICSGCVACSWLCPPDWAQSRQRESLTAVQPGLESNYCGS